MRIAVISDIHGNLDAFQQVLIDIDHSNIDALLCLGDNIGYGPEPEAVINLIRERGIPSVMGNHEVTVKDRKLLDWFNPAARQSLHKTFELLSEDSLQFILGLESYLVRFGCRFVHGFPPDSALLYLFQIPKHEFHRVFNQMSECICFVGHTHDLQIIGFDGRTLTHAPLNEGITSLDTDTQYIINIGSVGQPRDGNNKAKYVIWDNSNNYINVRFIPYDIASVVNKIIAAGLPKIHALRLW
jgi:predicted phosphodiesterase